MKRLKQTILLTVLLIVATGLQAQTNPKMEIKGTVFDDDGQPAISIVIRDKTADGEVYGITDLDGNFSIKANPQTTLHLSGLTYASKQVPLKGKTRLSVVLSFESQKLDEVVVVAKRITNKITTEPTEIEIVGNQYIIRPKVKIPRTLFKPNSSIVVQPILINATKGINRLFKPAVVTGRKYAITMERMLEFDVSTNPLAPYFRKGIKVGKNEVVSYADSLYMDNPNDEYRCDIYMYMVTYKKLTYQDTLVLAKGTVDPLRLFSYKMKARCITDEKYIPRPQKQLRSDRGQVNLTFLMDKAQIDESDPRNAVELTKMQTRLSEIQDDPQAELLSFHITGISSPEGRYMGNVSLAQKRTVVARDKIFACLRPEIVTGLRDSIHTGAKVETWEAVIALMAADSLPTQAISNIIGKYPRNMDDQYREIRRLPDYKEVIAGNYLPRLRKVEYSFTHSVMRLLNDEEIRQMYLRDYKKLMPYEFWRMYQCEPTDSLKEQVCRRALEMHPDFMVLANELAVKQQQKGQTDVHLLQPFITAQAPAELLNNQVAILLANREFARADSVAGFLPEGSEMDDIRAIVRAFNGDSHLAHERFASQGGTNEVVLLLAIKHNEEAYEKAMELPDEPECDYLRAITCNRTDKVSEAYAYLKRAINASPRLEEIAHIDGDVTDLMEQLDEQKNTAGQEAGQTDNESQTPQTDKE